MKKTIFAFACLFTLLFFCACAGNSAGGGTGSSADYAELITESRSADENKTTPIITSPEDGDFDAVFGLFGFNAEDMERYAISVSMINVKAYGVAVILPAEGRADAVREQMEGFVEFQQKSQENYLPDQYEIAKNALIETAPTGEILMVMSGDAPSLMAALKDGLAK